MGSIQKWNYKHPQGKNLVLNVKKSGSARINIYPKIWTIVDLLYFRIVYNNLFLPESSFIFSGSRATKTTISLEGGTILAFMIKTTRRLV